MKKGLGDCKGFRNTLTSQENSISKTADKESDGLPASNQPDSATRTRQSPPETGTMYHFRKHTAQSDLATDTRKATIGPGEKKTDDGKRKKKLRPRSSIKVILVFNVLPSYNVSWGWYTDK